MQADPDHVDQNG